MKCLNLTVHHIEQGFPKPGGGGVGGVGNDENCALADMFADQ